VQRASGLLGINDTVEDVDDEVATADGNRRDEHHSEQDRQVLLRTEPS